MKKLLILTFMMASMVFIVPTAQAATANTANSNAALTVQPRFWRGARRTVTTTRTVRVGYRVYRYTYRTTYNRNGRVISNQLIRRVRVR